MAEVAKPGPQVEFFGGPLDGHKMVAPGLHWKVPIPPPSSIASLQSDALYPTAIKLRVHRYSLQVFIRGEKRFPGMVYVGEQDS